MYNTTIKSYLLAKVVIYLLIISKCCSSCTLNTGTRINGKISAILILSAVKYFFNQIEIYNFANKTTSV